MRQVPVLCAIAFLACLESAAADSCEPFQAKFDRVSVGDQWTGIRSVFGPPTTSGHTADGETEYIYRLAGCNLTFRTGSDDKVTAKEADPPLLKQSGIEMPGKDADAVPPAVLYKVDPDYSEEARKAHLAGTVVLQMIVDANGKAKDIKVSRSLGLGLDEKAIEAVNKWKFRPGVKNGQSVAVQATIEVNFRFLEDAPHVDPPKRTESVRADVLVVPECSSCNDAYTRGEYGAAFAEYLPLAEQGNLYAANDVGSLYYHGAGVHQSYQQAVEWYRKAADGGLALAFNNLGHCYQKGNGVSRDYLQAEMWFLLAGPSADPEDSSARADVLARTTANDQARARRLAIDWLIARGRPFVSDLNGGGNLWARESLVHSVASSTAIIPEKGVGQGSAWVFATATRNKGRLWVQLCVWNIGSSGEVSIDPHQLSMEVLDDKGSTTVNAVPPTKVMGAGRTGATVAALVTSFGSARRRATYNGVDSSGDIYSGTITYNDPELERQRAEAVQRIFDQQAEAERARASVLLWPTVLEPTYYIRGGVEFRKMPSDSRRVILHVPVNGKLYSFPFEFQGKDRVGR